MYGKVLKIIVDGRVVQGAEHRLKLSGHFISFFHDGEAVASNYMQDMATLCSYYDIKKEDEDLPFAVIGRVVIVRVDEEAVRGLTAC